MPCRLQHLPIVMRREESSLGSCSGACWHLLSGLTVASSYVSNEQSRCACKQSWLQWGFLLLLVVIGLWSHQLPIERRMMREPKHIIGIVILLEQIRCTNQRKVLVTWSNSSWIMILQLLLESQCSNTLWLKLLLEGCITVINHGIWLFLFLLLWMTWIFALFVICILGSICSQGLSFRRA